MDKPIAILFVILFYTFEGFLAGWCLRGMFSHNEKGGVKYETRTHKHH